MTIFFVTIRFLRLGWQGGLGMAHLKVTPLSSFSFSLFSFFRPPPSQKKPPLPPPPKHISMLAFGSVFQFLTLSFIFIHFLSFSFISFIFFHFLSFSFIFFHFLSFSFIFVHLRSSSFIFFHFLSFSLLGAQNFDFFGPQFRDDFSSPFLCENQFLGPSRVVNPFGPSFPFFLLIFSPIFCLFSCFLYIHFLSFFVHFFIFWFFNVFHVLSSFFPKKKVSSFLFSCISFKYFLLLASVSEFNCFPPWSVFHGDVVSQRHRAG